ncbi:MAG: glutamine--tRNA ligase/YqeY domain fusion protein [Chromatiales bacterium]|nr:glutamine--tRNA ligase/YqeY domain fusion protein [Chromatiales bacterium]
MSATEADRPAHFIRQIIEDDLAAGRHRRIVTRFPPEPNGYLHIGHAKSICLNFGLALDYPDSICNLRFDDTNPAKEDVEFVDSIQNDVRWLGFDWDDRLYFASDYFERIHDCAVALIRAGRAYVCDLSPDETREYRGTLTEPGRDSPYRERSVEENLALFGEMRAGAFPDGSRTLRARIDMASGNINLRDPVLYRIKHGAVHHQTGATWSIYPSYDFTHPLSDAFECVTHSLCTLEFEDHRPLYDWVIENCATECRPRQIEFSRLELEYTVLSKRHLTRLVNEKHVSGWDDPRMPTIAGLRRRGYTPRAIRLFCDRIGITKAANQVELSLLENTVREDLDTHAPRRMAVLDPLKLVIDNWPAGETVTLHVPNHPKDAAMGERTIEFGGELWIDRADFRPEANKKFKRLVLGGEVRLRNAFVIRCDSIEHDEDGSIRKLHCSYDPETLGADPVGRKVRGVIHWVNAATAVHAEVRLYDRLFTVARPGAGGADFVDQLNPESLVVRQHAKLEPLLASAEPEQPWQFEREGYFCRDKTNTEDGQPVFNRVVPLRDTRGAQDNEAG